jgi:hypothetical protein
VHKVNVQTREDPHSLAPISLEGTSVDDEVAMIKKGRGQRLALTLAVVVVGVLGGQRLLRSMDERAAYASAAAQLEHVDSQQGEAYLRCALPNLQRSQLESASALHSAIEIATEHMDKGYGRVLAQCAPLLENLESGVIGLTAPPDMTRRLENLSSSVTDYKHSWLNYQTYLQDQNQHYDYLKAAPLIERITIAWEGYQAANRQAKEALTAAR